MEQVKCETLIVAGDHKQGRYIADELRLHPRQYRILSNWHDEIRGHRFKVVIYYGTWRDTRYPRWLYEIAMERLDPGAVILGLGAQ